MNESLSIQKNLAFRIREVRVDLYGEDEAQMAELAVDMGLPLATWRNFESGVAIPAEVLLKLEPNYREVLVLRFYEELSLEEIARMTRAPLSTVKSRLYRGLAALKPEVESLRTSRNPAEAAG